MAPGMQKCSSHPSRSQSEETTLHLAPPQSRGQKSCFSSVFLGCLVLTTQFSLCLPTVSVEDVYLAVCHPTPLDGGLLDGVGLAVSDK